MIKIEELRVGNWVTSIRSDKPQKVTYISSQKVKDGFYNSVSMDYEKENYLLTEHLFPIPLTPEILEKAGFHQRMAEVETWWLDCIEIHLDSVYWYSIDRNGEDSGSKFREITHLHQVQNLYYCLTGHELTLNL